MIYGCDYAWGRPSVVALRAAGVQFVVRYLSHDTTGKNLDRAEADRLSAAAIDLAVIWESTDNRALDGHDAGVQDARDGAAQAAACGMPGDRPVYFAVDFDADPNSVVAYFQGVAAVLGPARSGVYGGIRVVKRLLDLGLVRWGWQASAWSYGQWDPRAHIRQGGSRPIGGVDCDDDHAMVPDFGQWRVGVSPSPVLEDDDMLGQLNTGNNAVTAISWPQGRAKAIGFFADTGLVSAAPIGLRVAYHKGGGNYHVERIELDGSKGKTVVDFGADAPNVDAVSVRREDNALIAISWDAS